MYRMDEDKIVNLTSVTCIVCQASIIQQLTNTDNYITGSSNSGKHTAKRITFTVSWLFYFNFKYSEVQLMYI